MTKRWVGFPLILLLLAWSGIASATLLVTPSPVDVGNVVVADNATQVTATISGENGDNVDLSLTTTCTGAGTGTFSLVGTTTNLNLNAPKTFDVKYVPTTRGFRECDVDVIVNAGTSTPITFKVRATGVAPISSVSPSPLNFTSVRVNDAATVAHTSNGTLTIANTTTDAGQTLDITSVVITGTNASDFVVSSPGSSTVNPGANTPYVITFDPSGVGARTATVTVTTNDPINPTRMVTLNGTGTAAIIGVTDPNFGTVPWGSTTAQQNITVSNTASANVGTLTVASASITQSDTWFSFAAGTGCSAGSTSCTLTGITAPADKTVAVRCIPPTNEVGTQTAMVTFVSDSDNTTDTVSMLSCTSAAHPNVTVDVSSVAFGNQLVPTTSASQAVTVGNNGNSNLTFYFSETGTDVTMFAESTVSTCGTSAVDQCTLAPGATMAINVTFTPSSRGAKTATLNINTNDPDAGDNIRPVTLTGTGIAPVVGVSPSPLTFTSVRENNAAVVASTSTGTLTISNTTTDTGQTLTITSVVVSGTHAADFTITTPGGSSVNPGGSTPYILTFNPSGVGARTATVTVTTNDPINPTRMVTLNGTGLAAIIGVTDPNFGTVPWGSTTAQQNITVSNTASANVGTLTVSSASITQSDTWFSFAAGTGCSAGSTSCTLTGITAPADKTVAVRCIPPTNEIGTQTAMVTFVSDSDSTADTVSMLSCTSPTHPNVTVDVSTIPFGNQLVTTTSGSQAVTVGNNGNSNLSFYFSESGADVTMFAESTVSTCGTSAVDQCTLAPGATMAINVTFTPSSRGAKTATLNINTNDPDIGDNIRPVTLTGTGVAPVVGVSPTSYDYMGVRVNDSVVPSTRSQVFTISNTSTDTGQVLTISSVSVTGTNAGDFTITNMGGTSINPGANTPWTVTFNPSAPGARSATLNIMTNDPLTPNRTVALTGTGTTGVIAVSDVDFMTVSAGMISNQTITVSNSAAANIGTLTASTAVISSTSTWFSFGAGSGCTAGTTSCTLVGITMPADKTVPIRCSPPAAASGTATATVLFTSDSDAGGDNVAMLTCTAGRPNIAVNVTMLDFASVVVGQTSTAQNVLITNNGNTNLTYWLSETGTDVSMFGETTGSTCGFAMATPCTVAPGVTATVMVTFSPSSPGAKTATLNINNNDPDPGDTPKTVTLTGNGTAGIATPNMASIAFGNIEVTKTSSNTTLIVTNTGQSNLTITNAGLVSGAMLVNMTSEYGVPTGVTGTQTTVLTPTSTAMWEINCHPTSQGLKNGTFRIASNSFGMPNLDIPLTCTGLQGILTVTGGSGPTNQFDFGPVPQFPTTIPYRDFTLTNTGNIAVTNINYAAHMSLLGFTLVSPTPTFPIASLGSGASVTIRVQFNPMSGNDGCAIAVSPCNFTFTGGWGVTPTNVSATIVALGDGLVTGYDTSPSNPNPLDWGDIRFDTPTNMSFQILNTAGMGGADVGIGSLTIAPLTAMTGEFTVVGCCRGSPTCTPLTGPGPGGCPTNTARFTLPPVSNPIIVTVRAAPNNRIGLLTANLTVESNLGGTTPNRLVPLRANSITAGIAVTPATNVLDFGPVDLDANPVSVTRRITLTNTGTAALNVGNGMTGGPELARYTFTAITSRVVASGASFDIDVTYTPTIEKPANQPDVATLMFPITGVLGGPSSVTIQITGYGADRHIGVLPVPDFPDTFKNPGPNAPVMPVSVVNNGDVALDISAVMLDNSPIWTLLNPDPVSVPGRGTHDFQVQFAPLEAGKAPTGHLIIINNDNGMPMVSVELNGTGIDRRITFGPPADFGYVGIGLTSRLVSLPNAMPLRVGNDGTTEIRITGIGTNDDAFVVTDMDGRPVATTDIVLLPGTGQDFDVVFKPDRVGDYDANATLYIEGSGDTVQSLSGRGLYADARGGGGCSTTSGGSRGWLVLVLGVLVALRRRKRTRVGAAVLAVAAAAIAPARDAAADERDIDLDVFDPTPATVGRTFHVQHADIGPDGSWAASALVTYANNALVIDTTQNDAAPVATRALLTIGGAYVFGGRFEAGAHVPIALQSGDELVDTTMRYSLAPGTGASLADASLHLKARLGVTPAMGGTLAYGAGLTLTLPTATGDFGGNDKPTGRVIGLASLSLNKRLTATINAGGILRGSHRFANLDQGSGIAFGGGVTYWVIDHVYASGELFGELIPGGKYDPMGEKVMLNTIEGLVGAQYRPARTMSLGVALGRGVTSGPGTPAFRGILTFSYTPSGDELKPLHPPTKPRPPADDDIDGVPNTKDECPVDKEDKDLFQDDDGCPETDNDKDGIVDASDKCPLDAEDHDHIEDEDGCPDGDNDGDGIGDSKDKCPTAAEDKDSFQDQDGCPEPDNDKDGLVDSADKCPNEAEVINGTLDDDGCADKGDSLVVVSPDRLELLENVVFNKGAKIDKSSTNVLGQIGAHLRAHPEIARVRLTVHVNPTKDAAADMKLSEARAKAVRDWLVDWGIDSLRLQSSGFGGKQPLVPPETKGASQINDRLELIILERK